MSKRKPGIYGFNWFVIRGIMNNKVQDFIISWNQAKTYPQAIQFFHKHWPEAKGYLLFNAEPFPDTIALAC